MLIAEDTDSAHAYLDILMDRVSNKIHHAYTGTQAVEICRQNPSVNLILMDVKMPEMDGYEAAKKNP